MKVVIETVKFVVGVFVLCAGLGVVFGVGYAGAMIGAYPFVKLISGGL